ncbi:MAG TPA: phosphomannomutase/phosphoglucomutase [Patescibacteria group bacterium]
MKVDPSIFKAYDIRGIYPDTLNEEIAYLVGQGYANYVKPEGEVIVGCDVRLHSEVLKQSLIKGLIGAGVSVVDIGVITTDMSYFGVGKFGYAGGIQVTASHNPPEWHGFKFIKKGVVPLSLETGIGDIKNFVEQGKKITSPNVGKLANRNIEDEYCDYILTWLRTKNLKHLKVVINGNFGYGGKIFEKIVSRGNLPIELVKLDTEPNGHFPKGRPDPFIPENRVEFSKLVKDTNADLGITWDADADRVFFCANGGLFVEPYYLNTILIKQMLKAHPHEKVIYDPRYTWALLDAISESGGEALICRVGHSYIKAAMRENNALFATESSGHTYYRDYWYADCGMIPAMQVLEFLTDNNVKLSEVVSPVMNKYFISGEINTEVADKEKKMEEIAQRYKDGKQSRLDGIAVEYDNYRFVVRPSNTESLLRLTLEAKSKELMEVKRDEVLAIIRT